jgi:hypothetical protein
MSFLPQIVQSFFLRVGRCPGEQQLAEYADQQLVGNERHAIERHLAVCDDCMRQVGFLVRTSATPTPAPPEMLVRMARSFANPTKKLSVTWQWRPALGTAVAVGVFTLVTWKLVERPYSAPTVHTQPPAVEQARSTTTGVSPADDAVSSEVRGNHETAAETFVLPKANSTVSPKDLEFRWRPIAAAEYYEIEVVTAKGDLVWEKRLQNTSIRLPAAIRLTPGESYYVWLRVHSRLSGVLQTQTVRFTAG